MVKNMRLSIEEKATLITGFDTWNTKSFPTENIKSVLMSDGPNGLRLQISDNGDNLGLYGSAPATALPTGSGLASSWNRKLLHQTGDVIGREAASHGVNVVLGPAVNIKRSPLGGRNFEYFSEDPYLVGELATEYIEGLQAHGVGASIKHFALNNQETRRMNVNVHADERTMHEIYLAGFKKAITTAKPWTVMTAYNRVNGEYAANNKYLLNLLRHEWGYQGMVVSDWTGIDDIIASLKTGLNLEMPGNQKITPQTVIDAIKAGRLTEAELDAAIAPIIALADKAHQTTQTVPVDLAQQAKSAYEIASETAVLLKNEQNILPINADDNVLFVGAMLDKPRFQGGGSSHINAKYLTDIKRTLQATFTNPMTSYQKGYQLDNSVDELARTAAITAAQTADQVVVFAGLPDNYESEGFDRQNIDLPSQQNELISALAAVNDHVIVVLNNGAPVAMPWVNEVAAILEAYLPGQAVGQVIPDILIGKINPSGKLAETFPVKLSDTPSYLNFPGTLNDVYYGEGIFVGYRYYDMKAVKPLFAFGHGLSYTTFDYRDLEINVIDHQLAITVTITNTGAVAGQEVVQFYISDDNHQVICPPKELKQFSKVALASGESKTLTVTIPLADLAHYDIDLHAWEYLGGAYTVLVAASSTDIRLQQSINLPAIEHQALTVTRRTTIGELLGNTATKAIGEQILGVLAQAFGAKIETDKGDGEAKAGVFDHATVIAMLNDLPIRALTSFSSGAISESVVQGWIDAANNKITSI